MTVLLLCVVTVGCASILPGNDPNIVNAERALRAGDAIYKSAMTYYFTPGVLQNLGRDAITVLEKLRTGYDAPYQGMQKALDVYKLGRTEANRVILKTETERLAAVTNPAITLIPGKTLTPVEVK